MKLQEICEVLEDWAPLKYQESYDNSGLIVGNPQMELTGALLSLDTTEEVVEEAIQKGVNLIISHHPIVFSGIKTFTGRNYVERTLIKAIKNNIAIYAIHTNLDNMPHGVNKKIGEKLNLKNLKILNKKDTEVEIGSGMMGHLEEPMNTMDFLRSIKLALGVESLRYTKIVHETVSKIAFCGGSGSFLLNNAKAQGAQLFLTSDYKYHQFFDAENEIIIADIGHFEAEQYTKELIMEVLSEKFPTFVIRFSGINTNPINYL